MTTDKFTHEPTKYTIWRPLTKQLLFPQKHHELIVTELQISFTCLINFLGTSSVVLVLESSWLFLFLPDTIGRPNFARTSATWEVLLSGCLHTLNFRRSDILIETWQMQLSVYWICNASSTLSHQDSTILLSITCYNFSTTIHLINVAYVMLCYQPVKATGIMAHISLAKKLYNLTVILITYTRAVKICKERIFHDQSTAHRVVYISSRVPEQSQQVHAMFVGWLLYMENVDLSCETKHLQCLPVIIDGLFCWNTQKVLTSSPAQFVFSPRECCAYGI